MLFDILLCIVLLGQGWVGDRHVGALGCYNSLTVYASMLLLVQVMLKFI